MKTIKIAATIAALLASIAVLGIVNQQRAYSCGLDDIQSCFGGTGTSPYYQGQQDGIYDHEHGLVYNPIGQCSTCSGEDFQNGYCAGWNSYQSQNSEQGATVNINGNNNVVSLNQGSNQQQEQGPSPVGCSDSCQSPCSEPCGGPPVGGCDYCCSVFGPYFHHWHHFWGFHSEGPFGFSFHHIGFGGIDQ